MNEPIRTYIHRSHAVAIYRMPSGAYSFRIDGEETSRTLHASALAAEAKVDALVEDGPAPVGDARLPGLEMGGDA